MISLEHPWKIGADGAVVPLREVAADSQAAEMLPETFWSDERITRVLGQLSTDERRVAITYTTLDDSSWKAAAELVGMPPGFGERVRRELQRLGKEFQARQLAQAWTTQQAAAGSPASPVQEAASARASSMTGCPGPRAGSAVLTMVVVWARAVMYWPLASVGYA